MKTWIRHALYASLPPAGRALRRAIIAFIACSAVLGVLAPSVARAATPYSIHWIITQDKGSCETANLKSHNGEAYFRLNGTLLPTYQVPGALATLADGSETNIAEAGFDSVLLRVGPNEIFFSVANESGDDTCVHSHNVVSLLSPPLGIDKPLFDVRRDGTAFAGATQLSLSLAEINPPLAQDIANLETAIAAQRETIFANASKLEDLAAKLDRLSKLDTELRDLATRPLDEITQTDLDEILDRYADVVDGATRAAVEQLLKDLQQSVADLQNELASLIDNFGAQADAAAGLTTQAARDAGFNPEDPSGYGLASSDVPPVAIPNISGVPGAFSDGSDPYDAYADAVLAALAEDVAFGKVTARADFVAQVRAWRSNEKAIGKALVMNSASQAETNAYLKGQSKVTAYVQKYMDAQDWFKDSTVPADVRAAIGGVLKNKFDVLADQMKDALNDIDPKNSIDLSQTHLFKQILAFGGAMSAIDDVSAPYFEMMATLVHATTRVAIGFVPYVGPTLDFCEAVTGKAWCLPDGDDLSDEERIFSGAGVAIGSLGKFWGGVKGAGVGTKAAVIAEDIAQVDEAIAKGLHANPRKLYKTLQAACASKALEPFEVVAGKTLQEEGHALIGIGDDGVRRVLKILPEEKAPDFLSVTKGNKLCLSEVKSGSVELFGNDGGALRQLENAMKHLVEKGLADDVERVQIIMKKGEKLKNANYAIVDGYLVNTAEGNKRYKLAGDGYKKLVMIIQL